MPDVMLVKVVAIRQKFIPLTCSLLKQYAVGWLSKWLSYLECRDVLADALIVFPYMPICTFFSCTDTHKHTCPSPFAVCFAIIANTPLPSVHFTHDVAHLFTHLSELLSVNVCVRVCVCVCVHVHCELSCKAGAVLINGPSRWHMAMSWGAMACRNARQKTEWTGACAHGCMDNDVPTLHMQLIKRHSEQPFLSFSDSSSLPANHCRVCQHRSYMSYKLWEELSVDLESSWLACVLN